jgi:hypothetical protein
VLLLLALPTDTGLLLLPTLPGLPLAVVLLLPAAAMTALARSADALDGGGLAASAAAAAAAAAAASASLSAAPRLAAITCPMQCVIAAVGTKAAVVVTRVVSCSGLLLLLFAGATSQRSCPRSPSLLALYKECQVVVMKGNEAMLATSFLQENLGALKF